MNRAIVAATFFVLLLASAGGVHAQSTPAPAPPPPERFKPLVGPQTIDVGHDIEIALPADYLFLDKQQATKLMERNGNLHNEDLLGVIGQSNASWLVTVRYLEDGYVKDDEAAKLDADDI